jgi:hypothetical protein
MSKLPGGGSSDKAKPAAKAAAAKAAAKKKAASSGSGIAGMDTMAKSNQSLADSRKLTVPLRLMNLKRYDPQRNFSKLKYSYCIISVSY